MMNFITKQNKNTHNMMNCGEQQTEIPQNENSVQFYRYLTNLDEIFFFVDCIF